MIMIKLILMKPKKNVNLKVVNKEGKEFNVKTNDVYTKIYSYFFIHEKKFLYHY